MGNYSSTKSEINLGGLFIVIEESDLVDIIKQMRAKNLALGVDLGVTLYTNTPFKESLPKEQVF